MYESLFGNTHEVAGAIQDGIRSAMPHAQVSCLRATEANLDAALGADLLVIGGPPHGQGMTSAVTRTMDLLKAKERVPALVPGHQAEPGAAGPAREEPGIREWFNGFPGWRATWERRSIPGTGSGWRAVPRTGSHGGCATATPGQHRHPQQRPWEIVLHPVRR